MTLPRLALAVAALASLAAATAAPPMPQPATAPATRAAASRPLVIAHRGASGVLPEHTLAAYQRAIDMGADFIEPDLVITRDGILIARHENELSDTTDIADKPEFANRKTTKTIDGKEVTGWFAEDFTLAEIQTLRTRQRFPFRDQTHNGKHPVASFDQILRLVADHAKATGRTVGIYPETKHAAYFRSIGKPLEEPLVAALKAAGLDRADAPAFIQSFESNNLRALAKLTSVRLVQLIDTTGKPADADPKDPTYAQMLTPAGLADIAKYAHAVGVNKRTIVPADKSGKLLPPTAVIRNAHVAGLKVHAWTFRSDGKYLAPEYAANPARELRQFIDLGIDGLFTDFPDTAVQSRDAKPN